jgi:hypothetical protein
MSWDAATVAQVWQRSTIVPGVDATRWRKDDCGAWMSRAHYGNRQSLYGWEVDHVYPNGGDNLPNLRALQWQNNASKGDGRLTCAVTSQGNTNVVRGG